MRRLGLGVFPNGLAAQEFVQVVVGEEVVVAVGFAQVERELLWVAHEDGRRLVG